MSLFEKLSNIQNELKAPKNQRNDFGGFNYRSCEDILEAVKPLCRKNRVTLLLTDDLVAIDGRHYVKATAILRDLDLMEEVKATAFAREEDSKKGMDGSQITGASSSYARKYALNGLFNIDDTKDSDATNTGDISTSPQKPTEASKTKSSNVSIFDPKKLVEGSSGGQKKESNNDENLELICWKCKKSISERVSKYSIDKFGKPLCYECQQTEDELPF